jgi:isoleucyl-tRNA synthetase
VQSTGMDVTTVLDSLVQDLKRKGRFYRLEGYRHRYPECWRCHTPLVFRLVDEWFISMGPTYDKPREQLTEEEKNASLRYQMMDVIDQFGGCPPLLRPRDGLAAQHARLDDQQEDKPGARI